MCEKKFSLDISKFYLDGLSLDENIANGIVVLHRVLSQGLSPSAVAYIQADKLGYRHSYRNREISKEIIFLSERRSEDKIQ